jgi:hypothetical protein
MSDDIPDDSPKNDDNLFDKLGLSVQYGEVEIGQTYPIYGMITEFLCDEIGSVTVIVNHNIELLMSIDDIDKLNILKQRSFDPGIFVSKIEQIEPSIKGICSTVVFGKNGNSEIH